MKESAINNLKEDSVFWDNEYFQYKVTKVYKHNDTIHGVQAVYTWKNDFGTFYEKTYLSKEDLLTDEFFSEEFLDEYDCDGIGCTEDKEDGDRRMTREESEKYIKSRMCNDCGVYLGGGKCSDNCGVIEAIEALKQEPFGDTISRKAVYEQINCWIGSGEYRYTNATYYLMKRIRDIPSVT